MAKKSARKSARPSRTSKAPKAPPQSIVLVQASDRFDEAYERAVGAAWVLAEFSETKAGGDTPADERNFWQGLHQVADGLCSDLQQLKDAEQIEADYIFNITHGRPAGRGEGRMTRPASDGAR